MALISSVIAESGSWSHRLNEDAALDLLQRMLKCDSVYEARISSDCITCAARKKRRTLISALFCAKSTMPNAAAIPT
jgi:hypothetical protein